MWLQQKLKQLILLLRETFLTVTSQLPIASGENYRNAIDLTNKAVAISVTKKGAQPSIPTLDEIINYYKSL